MTTCIYIPVDIHEKINDCRQSLGKLIEQTASVVTLKRYQGTSLLKQTMLVKFTDKVPIFVMYNDQNFGKVFLKRQNITDIAYPIHHSHDFDNYIAHTFEFFLSIGNANDGMFGGYYARVLGSANDFTDYGTW